jgi:hypothetical protein
LVYRSLDVPQGLPPALDYAIRQVIDPALLDFHYLLATRHPEHWGPRGSMQFAQAVVLAAVDGAAQLLHPGSMNDGRRFRKFLKKRFPWGDCPAEGLSVDEACQYLWDDARCPLLHRFGTRHQPLLPNKLGNLHTSKEHEVEAIELSPQRPLAKPVVHRNEQRTVLWIENLYWGLRKAIEAAVSDPDNVAAAARWIEDGKFDKKRNPQETAPKDEPADSGSCPRGAAVSL